MFDKGLSEREGARVSESLLVNPAAYSMSHVAYDQLDKVHSHYGIVGEQIIFLKRHVGAILNYPGS